METANNSNHEQDSGGSEQVPPPPPPSPPPTTDTNAASKGVEVVKKKKKKSKRKKDKSVSDNLVIPELPTKRETKGPRTNHLIFIRQSIVKGTLTRHPAHVYFKEPVNPAKVKTYYHFIKRPMDLGTIRARLANDYYQSAYECLQDFQQMFCNCYLYNGPNTHIAKQGRELELILMRRIVEMEEEEEEEEKVISKDHKVTDKSDANGADIMVEETMEKAMEDSPKSQKSIHSTPTRRQSTRKPIPRTPFTIAPEITGVGGGKVLKGVRSPSCSSDEVEEVSATETEIEEVDSCSEKEDEEEEKFRKKRAENRKKRMALLQKQLVIIQQQMHLMQEDEKEDESYMKRKKGLSIKSSKKKNSATLSSRKRKLNGSTVLSKTKKVQNPKRASNGTSRPSSNSATTTVGTKRAKAPTSSGSSDEEQVLGDKSDTTKESASKKLKPNGETVSNSTSSSAPAKTPTVGDATTKKRAKAPTSSGSSDEEQILCDKSDTVKESASKKLKPDEETVNNSASPSPSTQTASVTVEPNNCYIGTIGSSIDRRDKCRQMSEDELCQLEKMINQLGADDTEEIMQDVCLESEEALEENENEEDDSTLNLKALSASYQWKLLETIEEKLKKQVKVTSVSKQ